MNNKVREMALKAGFVFLQEDESQNQLVIDWSSNYDNEISNFATLVATDCLEKCKIIENDITQEKFEWTPLGAVEEVEAMISETYKINDNFDLFPETDKKVYFDNIGNNKISRSDIKTAMGELHDGDIEEALSILGYLLEKGDFYSDICDCDIDAKDNCEDCDCGEAQFLQGLKKE